MIYNRKFRAVNEKIKLGETNYTITGIEGYGGTSVVYTATYDDKLNKEKKHNVFIKELFPFTNNGEIYRDKEGKISCLTESEELFRNSKIGFYRGNEINLELLKDNPEFISGNLNSYEAYGTYYSVLPVHGGCNLRKYIDKTQHKSLKDICDIIIKIISALDVFHRNGILHLDISPDNIIILQTGALLIDYNSTWNMTDFNNTEFKFSIKPGYSAPEVRLKDVVNICFATDMYSVCAIMFEMLTGHELTDYEIMGNNLKKSFPKNLGVFSDVPYTAAKKCVEIINKGLHTLSCKRFSSVSELREQINELKERIDKKGISHCALWEVSREKYIKLSNFKEPYIKQSILINNHLETDKKGIYDQLKKGDSFILFGDGGMGKTRNLFEILSSCVKEYKKDEPVVMYIPLAEYQNGLYDADYIRKQILYGLNLSVGSNVEDALFELEKFFDSNGVRLILLLDGLNEAGDKVMNLIKEIEGLSKRSGMAIIVSERNDNIREYSFLNFSKAEILPLSNDSVKLKLEQYNITPSNDEKLSKMLTNPMLLNLYTESVCLKRENENNDDILPAVHDTDSMVKVYLESITLKELRLYSGNSQMQLTSELLINHVLPEIAYKMRSKSIVSLDDLHKIIEKYYKKIQSKAFGKAFPKFMGKSRVMLKQINNASEWFDYCIAEYLSAKLGLLTEFSKGKYRLLHDNFKEYLKKKAVINKKTLLSANKKQIIVKSVLVTALISFCTFLAMNYTDISITRKRVLSKQEKTNIKNASYCLVDSLTTLNQMLEQQEKILEYAKQDEVINREENSVLQLSENIDKVIVNSDKLLETTSASKIHIENIQKIYDNIDGDMLTDLYNAPADMKKIMDSALIYLQTKLCSEDEYRVLPEARIKLVEVYEDFLKEYKNVIYSELDIFLYDLEDESRKEINESFRYISLLKDYSRNINSYDFNFNRARAMDGLYNARSNMKVEGYFKGE